MRQAAPPVEYEDTRTIATPEGVELELRLAGLGSRFSAGLIDFAIKGAFVIAAVVVTALTLGGLAAAIVIAVAVFLATVVYDVMFEVRAGGRTPGKRALGLRVVMADGGAIGLRSSAVRNLLRLVEGLPLSYVPAIVSILVTRDNQRLGDLAAGTVVVREPRAQSLPPSWLQPPPPDHTATWDVSAVTPEEMAAVRSFLDRREGFEAAARTDVASRLAERLSPRVSGVPDGIPPERFLEDLARVKASRR
jgi:uncharacterized RDD family membrane protein YckC